MKPEELFDFVAETGYRTKKEILGEFSKVSQEMVEMHLTYLVEKNKIRTIVFGSNGNKQYLYYIPYKDG